jgi:hypothetical protein
MSSSPITRRAALGRLAAAGLAAPLVFRAHAGAAPSETLTTPASGPAAWPGPTSSP